MQPLSSLLGSLASGHFVSGEQLAREIGISRAAVWKQVHKLRQRGVRIDAVRGRGYRLHGGTPLQSGEAITDLLLLPVRSRLGSVEVVLEVPSTNSQLLDSNTGSGPAVCIAEHQTAGRGRRGRTWQAPFGSSICFSVAYPFYQLPKGFGGLGLVAGIAIATALRLSGYTSVLLKWPNDLVIGESKLGGLLVESRGESGGATRVVIGVGINWKIPPESLDGIVEGPWTDLASQPPPLLSRDVLNARCINQLVMTLDEFRDGGLAVFSERWIALDVLANKPVTVRVGDEVVAGVCRGIDDEGALRVEVGGMVRRFTSGEVSVRSAG